jgi:phospholipase A1
MKIIALYAFKKSLTLFVQPRLMLGLFCGLGLMNVSLAAPANLAEAFAYCKSSYPSIFEAKKRLACFDEIDLKGLHTRPTNVSIATGTKIMDSLDKEVSYAEIGAGLLVEDASSGPVLPNVRSQSESELAEGLEPIVEPSFLDRKWRLTSKGDWHISDIETYKMNYLLATHNSNINNTPSSPNFTTTNDRGLDHQDVKFQISLKTELMNNIPLVRKLPYVKSARIWAAYTQQSFWQFFNNDSSRPFRENNYEPELILSLGLDNKKASIIQPYLPKMLNFGVVHQSNGREDPLSRSWNRLYLQAGWELNDQFTLLVRPAWRVPESRRKDDNPDIEKYMGYGDMALRWDDPTRGMAASILLRNNLRTDNKGFVQLDLQRQISQDRNINFHILASSGYGASLLDYNVHQSTIGFGISLGE